MKLAPLLILLTALSACGSPLIGTTPYGEAANRASIKASAYAVTTQCLRAPISRMSYLNAVNGELERLGSKSRATALDCDGSGSPDPLSLNPVASSK